MPGSADFCDNPASPFRTGGFAAVSAAGVEQTFPGSTEVVEIPRQGYDKLASRA